MGRQAEAHAKDLAEGSPAVAFYYLAVAVYEPSRANYMPIGVWVFIISKLGAEIIGPFLNEPHNIADVGGAS